MSENVLRENKMGVQPIGKLLANMAIPMMISMLAQAFYNVVDSVFVSRISENALTAVSLIFPIQNLMIAVSVGTGVGMNAILSRSLGAKQYKEAISSVEGVPYSAIGTQPRVITASGMMGSVRGMPAIAKLVA